MPNCLKWDSLATLGCILVMWHISSLWVDGYIPTKDEVVQAINTSRSLNEQKLKDLEGGSTALVCPMARYHHQGETLPNKDLDIITNDIIDAKSLLLLLGFTEEEISSLNVTETFVSESGRCCTGKNSTCDEHARYRRIDGTCNNLQHPTWGSAGSTQLRLLESVYEDGYNLARSKSVEYGYNLPNPRWVSNAVHIADRHADYSTKLNLHVFQMGQFLNQDIIETPTQSLIADCCKNPINYNFCLPIRIFWHRDPHLYFRRGFCMNFQRSKARFCGNLFNEMIREQVNLLTSFVDLSNIYGSSTKTLALARNTSALLNVPEEIVPEYVEDNCTSDTTKSVFCTIQGTRHLNIVPLQTAYRTLFVREHNRIIEELRSTYTDETELFQETKRLLVAIWQKIVYDEFLPTFLAPKTITKYKLSSDAAYVYSNTLNPTVYNEFGIAFRLGHTWIPRFMFILNSDLYVGDPNNSTLNDTFVSDFDESVDGFASQILSETAPLTDRRIEGTARSFLFLDRNSKSYDIAALNIQRGRDHGIPAYTEYRSLCGLSNITTFDELVNHQYRIQLRLRAVYRNVKDIDLFTGALSETHMANAEVGPTLACIIGKQFKRLKYGDRFWYQGPKEGYNSTQIAAIREYTFAKILCNNLDVTEVNYPNAFLTTNPLTLCSNIPQLDLSSFKTA